ncbi:MAG: hypothetical protein JWR10_3477 [Rubritepida sp.]|nr:hypothetical protein [Rubritepida sp.]
MRDTPQAAQFAELVKLHLRGRRFLDREKEMKLLEEGVMRYNLTAAEASGALRGSAEEAGVANQAELDGSTLQLLKTLGDRRGRVTRQDFGKVAAFYRGRAGSAMSEDTAMRQVKRLMLENDLEARRAGKLIPTRRWYRMIEA